MILRSILFVMIAAVLGAAGAFAADGEADPPRFEIEVEAGPVWQSKNDVQVPNTADGTRFSLVDVVGKGPFFAGRVYATWNISRRHGCRILLAPLSITETAALPEQIEFSGGSFAPGVPTEATYKFNSYRVSYRYRFFDGSRFDWWVGFTAKIRDAKIRLSQQGVAAEKTDLGFVPLLHVAGCYRFAENWRVTFDADALAGGPGRAEDVAVKIGYDISERFGLAGGYRLVEGGADVDEVYSFAWFHYAVLAGTLNF